VLTLTIDCGGSSIKAAVLDSAGTLRSQPISVSTPYPLNTELFVKTLIDLANQLPKADRATIGIPGMIRHGVVINTPHYITKSGPRTNVVDHLIEQWHGFDAKARLEKELGISALVLNDAQVHGAGVVAGSGLEVVFTFGTGLGYALFDGGELAPHLELSQAPVRFQQTYDTYIGEVERKKLGDSIWSRRVKKLIEGLRPVFVWDRVYLGGGNARRIKPEIVSKLGDDVVIVPNSAALVGGVRAWQLIEN